MAENRHIVTLGAVLGFTLAGAYMVYDQPTSSLAAVADTASNCTVIDGDTLRCGAERVRLLGIDAPELKGHCRRGRVCAPGDPIASTASLREAALEPLTIERVGSDR